MNLKKEVVRIKELVLKLMSALASKAEENLDAILPGYTHLQRAQPITFGHHLMAYAMMLIRDIDRFNDFCNIPERNKLIAN